MQNFNGMIEFNDKETIQRALDNFNIALEEAKEMKNVLIQRMKDTKVKYWFLFNTTQYNQVTNSHWFVDWKNVLNDLVPEEFTKSMYNTFWYDEYSVPDIIKQLVSVNYDKIYLTPVQAEFISYYTKGSL